MLFLNSASQFEQNVENGVDNLPESVSDVCMQYIAVLLEYTVKIVHGQALERWRSCFPIYLAEK